MLLSVRLMNWCKPHLTSSLIRHQKTTKDANVLTHIIEQSTILSGHYDSVSKYEMAFSKTLPMMNQLITSSEDSTMSDVRTSTRKTRWTSKVQRMPSWRSGRTQRKLSHPKTWFQRQKIKPQLLHKRLRAPMILLMKPKSILTMRMTTTSQLKMTTPT